MASIETGTRRKAEAKKIWDDSIYQIIAILQAQSFKKNFTLARS